MIEREPSKKAPSHIKILRQLLKEAKNEQPFSYDITVLKAELGLDSPEPDEKTLADRFFPKRSGFSDYVAYIRVFGEVKNLLADSKNTTMTMQQEQLAKCLVDIAQTQIMREGTICHFAYDMLLNTRIDMLDPNVKKKLFLLELSRVYGQDRKVNLRRRV